MQKRTSSFVFSISVVILASGSRINYILLYYRQGSDSHGKTGKRQKRTAYMDKSWNLKKETKTSNAYSCTLPG